MTLQSAAALAGPELILIASALAMLVWGAFQSRASVLFTVAAMAALVAAAVAAAVGPSGTAFSGGLIVDAGSVFAKVVIYLASAVSIPLGERWFARRGMARFEFPVLVLMAALGMGMMVSAGDLVSLYISIELQSLALYILAAFQRDDEKSSEAGLKYFVLGALSSGILLYGASLVYGFAGSTRFEVIAQAMSHGAGLGALFGLIFVICGIGFKVSAAPFHMWTPDVYEGAPTPVVGFFAGAPKLAAMVLLARVLTQSFGGALDQWRQVLVVMALLSVAVGAFAGLAQSNLKRLWAYSSIASIGYALVGLAAGGAAGIQSMLVFMVLYVVDVTGFFACLAALVARRQGDGDHGRLRRPGARAAGARLGDDRLLALGPRPAADQRTVGQVLCVQGRGRRRHGSGGRRRPGRQRGGGVLLSAPDQGDVAGPQPRRHGRAAAGGHRRHLRRRPVRLPSGADRHGRPRPLGPHRRDGPGPALIRFLFPPWGKYRRSRGRGLRSARPGWRRPPSRPSAVLPQRGRESFQRRTTTSPVSSSDLRLERMLGQPPDTASMSFEPATSIEWVSVSFTAPSVASSSIVQCE